MKYTTRAQKSVAGVFNIVITLFYGIKKFVETIKSLFVPKIVLTIGKINDIRACGLKYKFEYHYRLDEILVKEYPQALIGQRVHQYIYSILNKEIKFDLDYLTSVLISEVQEKYSLTEEDKKFFEKEIKKILTNFNNWYLTNKDKVFVVNYDIEVKHNRCRLKTKCDCILKDEQGSYIIVDFMTGKKNVSQKMLSYDTEANFQYYVLKKYFSQKKEHRKFKLIKFFLKYNNIVEFVEDWSMVKETEKLIDEVYEKLKNKEFEIHKGPLCGWCGYYDICPGWKIEREGDKQRNVQPVAPEVTLFRVARETPGRMALSYSKMSMYVQCPRRYRLCYLDRAGVKPHGFFSIGSTIHNTLELFYQIKPVKRKEPELEVLLDLYNKCWISAGYNSVEEEKEYYENGMKWLIDYYNKFVKDKYIPAYATEEYFELPIGKNTHVMIGYIDRIQLNPDGSFEIYDYKTDPKVRTQQEVDEDLQLTIYYWALRNKGIEVKRLGLIFMRFGEVVYTTRSQKNIDELDIYVKHIADKMWCDGEKYMKLKQEYEEKDMSVPEEIVEEIFPSKVNKYCGGCDYLLGCPKEKIIKTEYKDKLLFEVTETGEVIDTEIVEEVSLEEKVEKKLQ